LASGDDTDGIVVNALVTVSGSPSNLLFASNTPGEEGLLLDDVTIANSPALPEPSSMLLLSSGLLAGIAGLAQRRTRGHRRV
jgi:hypothetical protein